MEFEQFVGRNVKIVKKRKESDESRSGNAPDYTPPPKYPGNAKGYFRGGESEEELGIAGKICWIKPSQDAIPMDFCTNTSLHGLKYISQPKRHTCERLFWIIMFIIGVSAAVYLISTVWKKYNENPVIVSFDSDETSIESVPFPAITVCNNNKFLKSKATEILNRVEHDTDDKDALEAYYYLSAVCLSSRSFTNRFNFSLYEYSDTLLEKATAAFEKDKHLQPDNEIRDFLKNNSQKCLEMIPLCVFQDSLVNCSDLFDPIITNFGKCCTFNMFPNIMSNNITTIYDIAEQDGKDWEEADLSNSGLIFGNKTPTRFPRRQTRAGKSFGLSFILAPQLNESYCTNSDSYGFKLSMHLSAEIPNSIDFGHAIQPNSEVFISLTPEITKASPSIYQYALAKRQCYRENEFPLKYYRNYTVLNCQEECLTDQIFEKCRCVRFYMPRNDNLTLCSPENLTCTSNIEEDISKGGLRKVCSHCWPLCTELSFNAQISYAPLKPGIWLNTSLNENEQKVPPWAYDNISIVHVYFEQDSFYARLRTELFGFVDLVANTGGLLGLCLGFSALSGVEVIYFLTLRNLCQRQRRQSIKAKVARLWKNSKRLRNKLNPEKLPFPMAAATTIQSYYSPDSSRDCETKLITSIPTGFNGHIEQGFGNGLRNFPTTTATSALSITDLMSSSHRNRRSPRHSVVVNENGHFIHQYWNPDLQ